MENREQCILLLMRLKDGQAIAEIRGILEGMAREEAGLNAAEEVYVNDVIETPEHHGLSRDAALDLDIQAIVDAQAAMVSCRL